MRNIEFLRQIRIMSKTAKNTNLFMIEKVFYPKLKSFIRKNYNPVSIDQYIYNKNKTLMNFVKWMNINLLRLEYFQHDLVAFYNLYSFVFNFDYMDVYNLRFNKNMQKIFLEYNQKEVTLKNIRKEWFLRLGTKSLYHQEEITRYKLEKVMTIMQDDRVIKKSS